jgi:ATP synthase protein I
MDKSSAERGSLDQRLRDARRRQGLDQPEGTGPDPGPSWGFGLRAGVELVSAVLVAMVIGWMLDRWLGTLPWLLILFMLLGGAAGVLNVYRLFMPSRPVKDR